MVTLACMPLTMACKPRAASQLADHADMTMRLEPYTRSYQLGVSHLCTDSCNDPHAVANAFKDSVLRERQVQTFSWDSGPLVRPAVRDEQDPFSPAPPARPAGSGYSAASMQEAEELSSIYREYFYNELPTYWNSEQSFPLIDLDSFTMNRYIVEAVFGFVPALQDSNLQTDEARALLAKEYYLSWVIESDCAPSLARTFLIMAGKPLLDQADSSKAVRQHFFENLPLHPIGGSYTAFGERGSFMGVTLSVLENPGPPINPALLQGVEPTADSDLGAAIQEQHAGAASNNPRRSHGYEIGTLVAFTENSHRQFHMDIVDQKIEAIRKAMASASSNSPVTSEELAQLQVQEEVLTLSKNILLKDAEQNSLDGRNVVSTIFGIVSNDHLGREGVWRSDDRPVILGRCIGESCRLAAELQKQAIEFERTLTPQPELKIVAKSFKIKANRGPSLINSRGGANVPTFNWIDRDGRALSAVECVYPNQ